MATRIIKLPDVGEGVAEAEIVEWHVAVGDEVAEDQMLAAVMTDKATVEIPSPVAGTIAALGADVGTVLAVGTALVTIEVGQGPASGRSASAASATLPKAEPTGEAAASETVSESDGVSREPPVSSQPAPRPAAPLPRSDSLAPGEKPTASPSVRGRARDAGVDLRQVRGSGPAGRISHQDLNAHLEGGRAPAGRARIDTTETVKVTGLRRRIAERMAESTRRVAHFSYVEEVDVTALEQLRTHLNDLHAGARPRLSVLPFLGRACVAALRDFPQMNAHYDDEAEIITRHGGVHLGIATQTPAGLMVPVLHHAETFGLWDFAAEIRRLADAARDGSAPREALSGSTLTLTSLGELGGIVTTPVINRPEVAIIGVNRIAIRPVWENGQFVPRKMMNLSSSFDHRVIDGYDAARFIQRVKQLIEIPATLFIEA